MDGRPVAYATYGASDGSPLLLFHGTPGSRLLGRLYDRLARERGVRVLVPDRPGYGRSPSWDDRTIRDAGTLAAAVLDDADVASAHVAGFSGGGPHALAALATHPERVTGVDLVSTVPPPSLRETPPTTQRLLEVCAGRTPLALRGLLRWQAWLAGRRPALAVSQLTTDADALPDRVADAVASDFLEGIGPRRGGVVTESRLLASPWSIPFDDLDAPIRLYHGADDGNVPVDGVRRFADELPDASLTVSEDADHLTTLLDGRAPVLDRAAAPSN